MDHCAMEATPSDPMQRPGTQFMDAMRFYQNSERTSSFLTGTAVCYDDFLSIMIGQRSMARFMIHWLPLFAASTYPCGERAGLAQSGCYYRVFTFLKGKIWTGKFYKRQGEHLNGRRHLSIAYLCRIFQLFREKKHNGD